MPSDESNMIDEIIRKAVGGQVGAQMSQVNFAIKRNESGKLEYSVNGFNPEMVVFGFKALEKAVKEGKV